MQANDLRSDSAHYVLAFLAYVVFHSVLFAPAWHNGLLAPGDALNYYYPAFLRQFSLWSKNILSGYPTSSDPQFMTWYPPRWLLPSFNSFVISSYVLAAFFTYVLVYGLLRDALGAFLAGIVYSCGGFMIGHNGHTTMIHAAAWIPLIMAAVAHLSVRPSRAWWGLGSVGVACMLLAGHPQVAVYGICLAAVYALYHLVVSRATQLSAVAFGAVRVATAVAAGVSASAIQLLPLAELSKESVRSNWTFSDFTLFSLPLQQLPMSLFPFIYGHWAPGTPPYFGAWNLTELSCYFGISALSLIIIIGFSERRQPEALFWLATLGVAFLFMLGAATPLGHLAFQVPVLGNFRAPARAAVIVTLAAAVLSSLGLSALRTGTISNQRLKQAIAFYVALVGVFATIVLVRYGDLIAVGIRASISIPAWWQNATFLMPLTYAAATTIALASCVLVFRALAIYCLFVLIVVDLAAFGWQGEWNNPQQPAKPSDLPYPLQDELKITGGRVFPTAGVWTKYSMFTPNVNDAYDIPSAGGYGPLLPQRYARFAQIDTSGEIISSNLPQRLLRILAISHVVVDTTKLARIVLGKGCGPVDRRGPALVRLPKTFAATHIRVVSTLGCSVGIPQGEQIADIRPIYPGQSQPGQPILMRAGEDTAEWALERADVIHVIRHGKPANSRIMRDAPGLEYESVRQIDPEGRSVPLEALSLQYTSDLPGSISFTTLELENRLTGETQSIPINLISLNPADYWRKETLIRPYELIGVTRDATPRAWLVEQIVFVSGDQAIDAIYNGRLPNGQNFEPEQVVLIEPNDGMSLAPIGPLQQRYVSVLSIENDRWIIDVTSSARSFLVISQTSHPGWKAYINGEPTPLFQTNYVLQGIAVPGGYSRIELVYRPTSVLIGAAISTCSIALVLFFAVARPLRFAPLNSFSFIGRA
jgi:hypothetical protein